MSEIEVALARLDAMSQQISRLESTVDNHAEVISALREGFAGLRAEMRVWGVVLGIAMPFVMFLIQKVIK